MRNEWVHICTHLYIKDVGWLPNVRDNCDTVLSVRARVERTDDYIHNATVGEACKSIHTHVYRSLSMIDRFFQISNIT